MCNLVMKFQILLLFQIFFGLSYAAFSADFGNWLQEYFGEDVRKHLERADLGTTGSFGGKKSRNDVLKNQPVVFVHGVSNRAGDKMYQAAEFFRSQGYVWAELYVGLLFHAMLLRQADDTQVRALIVAVRLYTGRAVDVVGYSMGVPVSRKAILGGRCVDTGEDLGGPLTKFIDTYIGVAGPNHGISLQVGGISIPGCVFSLLPVCNTQTGLYSGFCPSESVYLQDINQQVGYEGQNRFSIYSKADQLVGYTVCSQ
uniref:Triacylglycerol lipase n=1 Tax=Acrobeloides nanus TaxID=290746 RepID=A0A914EF07_9BILA